MGNFRDCGEFGETSVQPAASRRESTETQFSSLCEGLLLMRFRKHGSPEILQEWKRFYGAGHFMLVLYGDPPQQQ